MVGFWFFMFVIDLLFPVIMIAVGKSFLNVAPKNINPVYGYRTTMSMKNRDTWEFAHNHCGKIWFRGGLILLPISVVPMLIVFGKDIEVVSITGTAICIMDTVILIASIFPTEAALKRTFDKDGNRKMQNYRPSTWVTRYGD